VTKMQSLMLEAKYCIRCGTLRDARNSTLDIWRCDSCVSDMRREHRKVQEMIQRMNAWKRGKKKR